MILILDLPSKKPIIFKSCNTDEPRITLLKSIPAGSAINNVSGEFIVAEIEISEVGLSLALEYTFIRLVCLPMYLVVLLAL